MDCAKKQLFNKWQLTNRPQFCMVYTLILHCKDHRNNAIKCAKLKLNHEPQASSFTAKFWTFYDVISMVYKSVDNGKLWSICFVKSLFFFYENQKKNNRHCVTCYVTGFFYFPSPVLAFASWNIKNKVLFNQSRNTTHFYMKIVTQFPTILLLFFHENSLFRKRS